MSEHQESGSISAKRKKAGMKRGFEENRVSVFCCIRPIDIACGPAYLKVLSSTCIEIASPNDPNKDVQYMFSKVFQHHTQQDVFNRTTLPLIENLLSGQNGLLFSYGVSGGGKTYTMTGEANNSGIVPRSLDVIFNSIGNILAAKLTFMPDQGNNFLIRHQTDKQDDLPCSREQKLFKKKEDISREHDSTKIENINTRKIYAVFITFVEVYNNNVYDLLENINSKESQSKAPQNKLIRCDSNNNMYVHGATEIEARNAEEAFCIYKEGNKRRKIAHTLLNIESSRSHSVFSIRVVQAPLDSSGEPVLENKQFLTVSQLSLVDLAGSERTIRTKHSGIRLKEAGKINNSLMTLRSCLEILKENQQCGGTRIVPYRDSKITLLFKNYFEREGKVHVIVCINPQSEDYEETVHVMRFATIGQEVVTPIVKKCRTDEYMEHASSSDTDNSSTDEMLTFSLESSVFKFTAIPGQVDHHQYLQRQFKKKEKLRSELKKMQRKFHKQVVLLERENTLLKQAKESLTYEIDLELTRQASLQKKVRCIHDSIIKLLPCERDQFGREKQLKNNLKEKDMQIRQCLLDEEKIENIWKEKLAQMKQEMKDSMQKEIVEEIKIHEKNMQEIDAKLMRLEALANQRNIIIDTGGTCTDVVPFEGPWQTQIDVQENTRRAKVEPVHFQGQRYHHADVMENKDKETVVDSQRLIKTDNKVAAEIQNTVPCFSEKSLPSWHAPSNSTGVWLNDRPAMVTKPRNTFCQPLMVRSKPVTQLKKDDVTKYSLMIQGNDDGQGLTETTTYKGDVVPTFTGGAQVILNDVETVTPRSPLASPGTVKQ